MSSLNFLRVSRKQTIIILVLCILLVAGLLYYRSWEKRQALSDVTCRAEIVITNNDTTFKGVLDIKSGVDKGIANITGVISDASEKKYHIQRMVLFSMVFYGISPVWTSDRIIISDAEGAPQDMLLNIFPEFYVRHATVTDADIIYLNPQAWLLTKSSIPYMYCKKYKLINSD